MEEGGIKNGQKNFRRILWMVPIIVETADYQECPKEKRLMERPHRKTPWKHPTSFLHPKDPAR